jgi:hypothetical protein
MPSQSVDRLPVAKTQGVTATVPALDACDAGIEFRFSDPVNATAAFTFRFLRRFSKEAAVFFWSV